MDEKKRCTAKSKRSGERCKRAASLGRNVCAIHGGKSPRGVASASFRHGRYSKALPHRLLHDFDELRSDPELVSLRDELALVDLRLQEKVNEWAWGEIKPLIETRQELAATEARIEVLRDTTMTQEQTMTLIAAILESLRRHVHDPVVIDAIGREVEELLVG